MVVLGCPWRGAQQETGSRRDRTTQRGRSLAIPRVPVHIRMGRARYRATHWRAVLATACWFVEGYRTPNEAPVC